MMEFTGLIQQKPLWLATSFFCSRDRWNIILKKTRRIVEDLRYDLLSYHIQTNNQYGENIRVSFLTVEEKIDDVGQTIRLCFEPLFSSFPEEAFKTPISSIALPFPTNTFEFGLYEINFHEKLLPTYKIQEVLSKAMMEGLEEEEIASDTLVTFSLYLQVSLIKACSKFLNKREEWLSIFIPVDSEPNVVNQAAKSANLDLVFEITSEVMGNDKFDEELAWLDRWYRACFILIEKEVIALEDKGLIDIEKFTKEFYLKSAYFIYTQLGLSQIEIRYANRLFNYSLKKFYRQEEID